MIEFKHLFQPITLGKIHLKNRMVMLSMGLGYEDKGKPTQRLYNFLGGERGAAYPQPRRQPGLPQAGNRQETGGFPDCAGL